MQIKKLFLVIGTAFLLPTNAMALSCAQSGFQLLPTAKANKASGKNVIYVRGRFFDLKTSKKIQKLQKQSPLQRKGIKRLTPIGIPTQTIASFIGTQMTAKGEKKFTATVKIKTTCAGNWCGKPPKPFQNTIAALTKKGSQYELNAGPCSPNTFNRDLVGDWQRLQKILR